MIKINLLPAEAAEKEAKKKFIILGILVAGLLVGTALFFLFVRIAVERTLAAKKASLQKELTGYKVIVAEVDKLKEITGTLEERKRIIETLMKGRLLYPRFMERFLEVLPPTVWISQISTRRDGSSLTLNMNCNSFDNFGIADFISNLESSAYFSAIDLVGVNSTRSKDYEVLHFQLNFSYSEQEGGGKDEATGGTKKPAAARKTPVKAKKAASSDE
jgi:Tfp pilus assembly protein PilN